MMLSKCARNLQVDKFVLNKIPSPSGYYYGRGRNTNQKIVIRPEDEKWKVYIDNNLAGVYDDLGTAMKKHSVVWQTWI